MAELADAADLKSVLIYCTTAKHLKDLRLDREQATMQRCSGKSAKRELLRIRQASGI